MLDVATYSNGSCALTGPQVARRELNKVKCRQQILPATEKADAESGNTGGSRLCASGHREMSPLARRCQPSAAALTKLRVPAHRPMHASIRGSILLVSLRAPPEAPSCRMGIATRERSRPLPKVCPATRCLPGMRQLASMLGVQHRLHGAGPAAAPSRPAPPWMPPPPPPCRPGGTAAPDAAQEY